VPTQILTSCEGCSISITFYAGRTVIMISGGDAFMDSKRVWEVALTVVAAIFLLVAVEGRHPYGFYMVLRTAATVGGVYLGGAGVSGGPRGWM
jgi:hypothetical protein